MKKQLRNIAFAAAVLACGSAVAQDAPKVLEPAWQQVVTASGAGNIRYGQGFGGVIYMQDRVTKSIVTANGTEQGTYITDERLDGIALTIDQAGNIVAGTSFAGAASTQNFLLIDKEKNVTPISIADQNETGGRSDEFGRAIGDFTSAEGGVFYVAPAGLTEVYAVNIINGAVSYPEKFGFASSDPIPAATSTCIAQPRYESIAAMYQAVEDGEVASASDAFYYKNRSNKFVQYFNGDEFETWASIPDTYTTDGFDWFELQGKKYVVFPYMPASPASHTNNFQIFCVTDNEIVAVSDLTVASQAFQQYTAEKVSDTKVNIYTLTYVGDKVYCSMTPFEVGGGEEENVVYFDNTNTEWEQVYAYIWDDDTADSYAVAWPGTELTEKVGNVYSYTIPEGVYNKIIFNNNAGQQTGNLDLVLGTTYEGEKPVVIEADYYVLGNIKDHSWNSQYMGAAFTKVADGVYEIGSVEFENGGNDNCWFRISSQPGNDWSVVNAHCYGAPVDGTNITIGGSSQVITPTENNWIIPTGTYKLTFNTTEMTLTVSTPSGVEAIEAEDAPAVYYNLQGVKIDNPANGLYIVKRGNKVSKVMVK
ncbi:MAG: starch-binding protein [Muribaculaceae bacterium]|nr:starch-binding protein [Muribaculaceae bacterium]